MAQSGRFPRKNGERSIYIKRSVGYLAVTANKTRLKVTDAKLLVVTDELVLFNANEIKYNDPSQRTIVVTQANLDLMDGLKIDLNSIYGDIPNSALTTDDRNMLLIFERGAGNTIPAVDFSPTINIDSVDFSLIRLKFSNPNAPSSSAMPRGQSIFLEYYVGAAGLAATDIPYANGTNVSTATTTILFEDGDLGKTCYMRCYYENTRHERGPKSVTITKVVA